MLRFNSALILSLPNGLNFYKTPTAQYPKNNHNKIQRKTSNNLNSLICHCGDPNLTKRDEAISTKKDCRATLAMTFGRRIS
ncbi:MAG: hypothetical protein C4584_02470 [Armatimonadetes bacterium]|nr:MAG: hypothetical protein C4584_02470 [Armatimonadota bacterium]